LRCCKNGQVPAFYRSLSKSPLVFGVGNGALLLFWVVGFDQLFGNFANAGACQSIKINPLDYLFVIMEGYSESSKVC